MRYFTVGTNLEPTYTIEHDPEHCFQSPGEAEEELEFLQKEYPELNLTCVWVIEKIETRHKWLK